MRRSLRALPIALILLAGACSRAVEVSSGPAPTYPVSVRNALGEDVIVAYDDGGGARTLGTIRAGTTERFIIAQPATPRVSILARSVSGEREYGPFAVDLVAGETRSVTVR